MYFCNMEWEQFILEHSLDDVAALALARKRHSDFPEFELALSTLECRKKLKDKVPEWYALPSLRFPLRLSAEQCSSSETARYKASVAKADGASSAIADLTGGLGVDAWAFSRVFGKVLYNEMKAELSAAAAHNFRELGAGNITVRNCELKAGNLREVLDGFQPDVIFLDPARRNSSGRKVFRLEDCTPNVMELLPELLEACPKLLLKLSPMADITLVCHQLGHVKEVHVVAAGGECKELLLLLERGWSAPYSLRLYSSGSVLPLGEADLAWTGIPCIPEAGWWLFDPGKALLKAGAFALPCYRFGMSKIERHTHIYVSPEPVPEQLRPFGRVLEILEVAPLDKRSLKEIGKKYGKADVTACNIPLTSDELRRKAGMQDGAPLHLYGVKSAEGNLLLICKAYAPDTMS